MFARRVEAALSRAFARASRDGHRARAFARANARGAVRDDGDEGDADGYGRTRESSSRAPRAAYVHLPFCRSRCYYCDFAISVVGGAGDADADAVDGMRRYAAAVRREIAETRRRADASSSSSTTTNSPLSVGGRRRSSRRTFWGTFSVIYETRSGSRRTSR